MQPPVMHISRVMRQTQMVVLVQAENQVFFAVFTSSVPIRVNVLIGGMFIETEHLPGLLPVM